jgi:hypothetical protein
MLELNEAITSDNIAKKNTLKNIIHEIEKEQQAIRKKLSHLSKSIIQRQKKRTQIMSS